MSLMYVISKIVTFLLLPPGIFILLLFVASFVASRGRGYFIIGFLLFWFFSTPIGAHLLLKPLEQQAQNETNTTILYADAIIVLGGGVAEYAPNFPLQADSFKRAVYGLTIARSIDRPLIFTGGSLHTYTEAQGAKESFDQLAYPLGFILPTLALYERRFGVMYEDKSVDTVENGRNIATILQQNGINKAKIVLVTSAYHMARSRYICEKLGFSVISMPTDYKCDRELILDVWSLFPQAHAFYKSYLALHEYAGLFSVIIRPI